MHAHDVGHQKTDRLAEHACHRFDTADAPAEHSDAIHHRGMRVGANERVRIEETVLLPHPAGQILEVDLVHDAVAGGHDPDTGKRLLAPLEKREALTVASIFKLQVAGERVGRAPDIDLHLMVHDKVDRNHRLDARRIAAQPARSRAHRGKVVERRKSREVLQQNACDHERDFHAARRVGLPRGKAFHVFFRHALAVAIAQQRLEHDPQAARQSRDSAQTGRFQSGKRIVATGVARRRPKFP